MTEQELNLLELTAAVVAQLRTCPPRIMRRHVLQAGFLQQVLTTYQTTFCDKPLPHTFPSLATLRKIFPSVTLAARIH